MDKRPLLVVAVVALVGVWVLRSCGGSGGGVAGGDQQENIPPDRTTSPTAPATASAPALDAAALLERAHAAASQAASVHLTGTQELGAAGVFTDLTLTRDGSAIGQITPESTRFIYDVVRVGPNCYVKGPTGTSLTRYDRTCAIPLGDGLPALDLRTVADFGTLVQGLSPARLGAVRAGEEGSEDGRGVVVLTGGGNVSVSVPTSGDPSPLRLRREGGNLKLSDWDDPVTIAAPTNTTN